MRTRVFVLFGLVAALVLATCAPALAVSGVVTSSGCGLASCHSHPGFTDFASWHASHQAPNMPISCEMCHPNNHTLGGPPSAPDATYSVAEACGWCHVGMDIAPAHPAAALCVSCHYAAGTFSGCVSDASGPLVGVSVTIDATHATRTYAGGQYIAANIPVGTYDVTYSMPGYVDQVITGVEVTYAGTTTRDVVLAKVPVPDVIAPITTSDAKATYDGVASILLDATDNQGGSGVASTQWRLDGGVWTAGSVVSTSSAGSHVLEFYSTDAAGNTEAVNRLKFVVRVPALVGNPVAPSTMSRYRYYTVYATLRPRHAANGYPVRIYKWKSTSSGWKSYGYVTAKAANYSSYTRCARSLRLPSAGRWRLRAYAPADALHTATWSIGSDYVTVK